MTEITTLAEFVSLTEGFLTDGHGAEDLRSRLTAAKEALTSIRDNYVSAEVAAARLNEVRVQTGGGSEVKGEVFAATEPQPMQIPPEGATLEAAFGLDPKFPNGHYMVVLVRVKPTIVSARPTH